ncbi:hypothetical protein AMS68_003582 [Peltaster fructicola]|uniref:Uncharacterized protein n=1 Tax=Peltaster fructicola TaxID=286661 RepID=A0A6H0XTU5_9PEZI|nr:hypothetical protein AMS68_003582 [Peltaster fructicola]
MSYEAVTTEEWLPWKLKLPWMLVVLVLETSVVITVLVLAVISIEQGGIALVTAIESRNVLGFDISQQLLWTTLPAALMTLLRIGYGMIVDGTAEREPYVELGRRSRSARVTIFLEYLTYPIFYGWCKAFASGHFLLGAAMLINLVGSLVAVPLVSALFVLTPTDSEGPAIVESIRGTNLSLLRAEVNMQPALDVSNALLAYNASAPAWMDFERSYDPFDSEETTGNLTARTSTYYTDPNCSIIPVLDGTVTIDATSNNSGRVWVTYTHGGCNVTQNPAAIGPDRLAYVYAFFQPCGGDVNPVDRLGLLAASYDKSALNLLRNITIISCMPVYWTAQADVTMAFAAGRAQRVLSVSAMNGTAQNSTLLRALGSFLSLYEVFTPSGQLKSNSLGNAVHAYASATNVGTEVGPDIWQQSMTKVHKTIFAAVASSVLTGNLAVAKIQTGILHTVQPRLHLSFPIVIAFEVCLLLMALHTLLLLVYVRRSRSILTSAPDGLFGREAVLNHGEVGALLEIVERQCPAQKDQWEFAQDYCKNMQCWYDGETRGGKGRLRVDFVPKRAEAQVIASSAQSQSGEGKDAASPSRPQPSEVSGASSHEQRDDVQDMAEIGGGERRET